MHDQPRSGQGEDVHYADETPLRSHMEDGDAGGKETCGKILFIYVFLIVCYELLTIQHLVLTILQL